MTKTKSIFLIVLMISLVMNIIFTSSSVAKEVINYLSHGAFAGYKVQLFIFLVFAFTNAVISSILQYLLTSNKDKEYFEKFVNHFSIYFVCSLFFYLFYILTK